MQSKYTPLGILGIILIAIGLLVWAIQTQFSPYSVTPLVLGGILALVYAIMNVGFLTVKLTGRTAMEGANMAVGVIIVLAIMVFLQIILSKYSTRFDLTEAKKFTLASQTIQMLKGLEEELLLQYLINPNAPDETVKAKDLMDLYQNQSSKIEVEVIDPDKNPTKVQELAPVTLSAIYVRKGDQHEKVSPVNENNLTNAIMKLVKGGGRVVYFTTGHDEHPFSEDTDRDGMSGMKKLLEEEGYLVKEIQLATVEEIPSDAVAVVIAGPKRPFFETEIQTLQNYLRYGGRLAVMLDPENQSGLESFLNEDYGVVFGNNYIVDNNPLMRLFGGGNALSPMISDIESHPIVDAFQGGVPAIPFPIAQSVKMAEDLPEGVEGAAFIKTSQSAWGESDIEALKTTQQVKNDMNVDEQGPMGLAAAVSKPAEEKVSDATEDASTDSSSEEAKEEPETRLVVFGDSDFATNKLVNNSYDLFINSVNWLTKQEDLISIRPKDDSGQPVMISQVKARFVFYTSLVILPLTIAIIGAAIVLTRRLRG
ncbi:MAG: GldG family protein [Candidatus Omnitrophica bacterium]|nr:GldG family protein [Candidatus Omnitrophota bacterium]